MVGYSGTPLARKLGIALAGGLVHAQVAGLDAVLHEPGGQLGHHQRLREGSRLALLGAPDGFDDDLVPLPQGVHVLRRLAPDLDVALLFVTERRELERRFPAVAGSITPAGGFWVAWPKRASKVLTDLTEDVLREVGLPQGLVDNKACAVNEIWSALRFVWRKENRPGPTRARAPGLPSTGNGGARGGP